MKVISAEVDSDQPEDKPIEALTEVEMPEIDPAFDYLLGLFYDMGQCISTGMGLVPISWQEMRAWRLEKKLDLTLWEKETLRKMSEAYCAEHHKSSEPNWPAPYRKENEEEEVDAEVQIVKAMSFRETLRATARKK